MQQPRDLATVVGMAEDRQRERRLGDEQVAFDRFEAGAGRVAPTLVVARDDDAASAMLDHDLGAAEHVSRRQQADGDIAEPAGFAVVHAVVCARRACAETRAHDGGGRRCRQHRLVAGARVVGMAVRDHRAVDGAVRVDVEIARDAVEAASRLAQPTLRRGIA